MCIEQNQNDRFNAAIGQFIDRFGYPPFFDGMTVEQMQEDLFIDLINQAVENNDPDINLTSFFPDGRNV
ncbi:MAG: hypothetical protein PSN44_05965 [Gammaproteobacteria bacterium]|nr:hypothetical protein [Gammaproteobacteria bacterium]